MKADTIWTQGAMEHLKKWAGRVPDKMIAADLGCAEITVRKARAAMGLAGFHRARRKWTRRDALLNGAAGLDF
jgi:hypothetical protein